MLDSSLEQRLGMHDESLRSHRERFEAHKKWLQGQRSTPSFTTVGADEIIQKIERSVQPINATANLSAHDSTSRAMSAGDSYRPRSATPVQRRNAPVYNALIEKGKLYDQNKERLREEAVLKELSQLRDKPLVSDMARHLKREDKIEDRFLRLEQEKRQVAEWNRQRLAQKEEEEQTYPFQPQISKRGKQATSRTKSSKENNTLWVQKREEQLESMRMKRIIAEMAEVRGIPEIDERSARLAERKIEKLGLAGYSHLDTLLERDRLSRMAAWERQQVELRNAQPGNPRITAFAAALPRDGDVFDRLYQASVDSESRIAGLVQRRQEEEETFSYTPRITNNAQSIAREKPVEDDLLERHAHSKAIQEQQIRMMIERERELHVPAINPVSDEIAARLPETSKDRLFKPRKNHLAAGERSYPSSGSGDASHHPNSGTSSPHGDSGYGVRGRSATGGVSSNRDRIEHLYQREMQRQERLDQLRAAEIQRQMDECTFHPATRTSGDEPARTPLQVYHRVTQWARRRDQKIQEQRMERERHELSGCTFRPVNVGTIDIVEANDTIYGGDGKAWGFDEYIERQRIARKRQMEKEAKMHPRGEQWKNVNTVPQEFQLGRRDKPIKSLQKPLEAPIQPPNRETRPALQEEDFSISSSSYAMYDTHHEDRNAAEDAPGSWSTSQRDVYASSTGLIPPRGAFSTPQLPSSVPVS